MNEKSAERSTAARRRVRHTPESELAQLLSELIERDGRTLNGIALAACLDVGYLWRLRAGDRQRPSRDVLIRLGLALRLDPEEVDQLLVAAEFAPITGRRA